MPNMDIDTVNSHQEYWQDNSHKRIDTVNVRQKL